MVKSKSKARKTHPTQTKESLPQWPYSRFQSPRVRFAIGLIAVALVIYLLRGLFIVAIVDGKPIWRLSIVEQLESEGGKRVLDQLVTTTLIYQEANRQNVRVDNKEVEKRIKEIEENLGKQGQTLDSVLALQGMSRSVLVEQLTLQMLIEKMLGKDIVVTDKEVADYIGKNKDLLPVGSDSEATKVQVREQLKQQKVNDRFKDWITNLQKSAKILYMLQY